MTPTTRHALHRPGHAQAPVHRPLATTVTALRRRRGAPRITTRARGRGWTPLHDRDAVTAWYRSLADGRARGHRDVAGALVAYDLGGAVAGLVAGPLVLRRRVVLPRLAGLRYARDERYGPPVVALGSAAVLVRPDDPDAAHPAATVVADDDQLLTAAAASLVALFAPIADAVRACAPYGRSGMWGNLADQLAETAVAIAHPDARRAWALADALVDRLAAHQPLLRGRPRAEVDAAGAVTVHKGTCCLVYKLHPGPDRITAAACTTCPLRRSA